ncbi:MAG: SGNH/GDSL hydrolase family protein [Pirellulales bacterium]|nr:SGNH/GDSL hydrolase family protein [Pirellulales bacterium]
MRHESAEKRHPGLPGRIGIAMLATLVLGMLSTVAEAATPDAAPATRFQKVLFLGNSITLHGPAPNIGWVGNWGMAASAADKDFVHIVTRSLAKTPGAAPETMVKNIATFERQYASYDIPQSLKDAVAFQADLLIVAIGENVPGLKSDEEKSQFAASVEKLLQQVRGERRPTIIVRSSFWPNQAKDEALRQACRQVGGTFVDISGLSKDESNYARSERDFQHAGVAAHPGDRGMQAIADAILKALEP